MRAGIVLLALSLLAGDVFGETMITVNGNRIRTSGNSNNIAVVGSASGETTITVNGKTIRTTGKNISINDGMVVVDGKVLIPAGESTTGTPEPAPVDEQNYVTYIKIGVAVLVMGICALLVLLAIVLCQRRPGVRANRPVPTST